MSLTQQDVEQFVRDGAVIADFFDADAMCKAQKDFDKLYATDEPDGCLIHQYVLGEGFEALLQDPQLEEAIKTLLATDSIHLVASATLYTAPGTGDWSYDPEALHVDIQYSEAYWTKTPRSINVTCMIFLDDVTAQRAPTVYIPGSHRKLAQRLGDEKPNIEYPQNIKELNVDDWELAVKPICGKQGQIAFSTTALIHAGSKNITNKARKVLFASFSSTHVCHNFNADWNDRRIAYLEQLEQRFRPERKFLVQSSLKQLRKIAAETKEACMSSENIR